MSTKEELIAKARKFVAKMDKSEGGDITTNTSVESGLFTVMLAMEAGMSTEDWNCTAQAWVMLESIHKKIAG